MADSKRYEPSPENDGKFLTDYVKDLQSSSSFHLRAKRFAAAVAHMSAKDAQILLAACLINGGTTTPYTFPDEL